MGWLAKEEVIYAFLMRLLALSILFLMAHLTSLDDYCAMLAFRVNGYMATVKAC